MLKLYTKPKCFYCRELKKKLTKWGYSFAEFNSDVEPSVKTFMASRGHTTYPQLYYEGVDMMQGPSTELYKSLLQERMAAAE